MNVFSRKANMSSYPWPCLYPPNFGNFSYPGVNSLSPPYGYFPYPMPGAYPGFNYAQSSMCRGQSCPIDSSRRSTVSSSARVMCQGPSISTTISNEKMKYEYEPLFERYKKPFPSMLQPMLSQYANPLHFNQQIGNCCSTIDPRSSDCRLQTYQRTPYLPLTPCTSTVQNNINQSRKTLDDSIKNLALPKCDLPNCKTCPRWVLPGSGYCNLLSRSSISQSYLDLDYNNNLISGQSFEHRWKNELSQSTSKPLNAAADYKDTHEQLSSKQISIEDLPVYTQIGRLNRLIQTKELLKPHVRTKRSPVLTSSANSVTQYPPSYGYPISYYKTRQSEDQCKPYVYPALFRLAQLGGDTARPRSDIYGSKLERKQMGQQPRKKECRCWSGLKKSRRKQSHPQKSVPANQRNFRGVTIRLKIVSGGSLSIQAFFSSRKLWKLYEKKRKQRLVVRMLTREHVRRLEEPRVWEWVKQSAEYTNTSKHCASCGTRKTPLWRDAEDGTPLCNACGIRYKKYRVRCLNCCYIPRKSGKLFSECLNCGGPLRLHLYKTK